MALVELETRRKLPAGLQWPPQIAEKPEAQPEAPPALTPAKPLPLLACLAVGLVLRYAVPIPAGITVQGWQLLSIFVATIAGVILQPLPVGAWSMCALTACVATQTLTYPQALSALTLDVVWLIVAVMFVARAFVKSGLGNRCGFLFARAFGRTTLGLAYALTAAEAMLAPALPSTAARHGGVLLPVILSLSRACGSDPEKGTERKMGAFLIMNAVCCCGVSSAMFLTGAAQNLLCVKLAAGAGAAGISWLLWFKAAAVPGVAALLATPLLVYKLFPPETTTSPDAPAAAAAALAAMGPVRASEKIVMGVMAALFALWVGGGALGVPAPTTALLGVVALLASGVLSWSDCLAEKSAWDTLIWFSVLVGMSGALANLGVIATLSGGISGALQAAGVSTAASFVALHAAYAAAHYLFASQTAHAGALYAAFLAMMVAAGAPPLLSALTLSTSTNLFGAITHYASAQSAVYFGTGYIKMGAFWRVGLTVALAHYAMWVALGLPWWRVLGLL